MEVVGLQSLNENPKLSTSAWERGAGREQSGFPAELRSVAWLSVCWILCWDVFEPLMIPPSTEKGWVCFRCESQFQPFQGWEKEGKRSKGSLLCLGMSNPLTFISRLSSKGSLGPSQCHTTLLPQGQAYFGSCVWLCKAMIPSPFPCQHPRLFLAWDHPSPLDDNSFQRQTRLPTAIVLWLSAYLSPSLFLLPLEALNFSWRHINSTLN